MSEEKIIKNLRALKNSPVGGQAEGEWLLRNKEILFSQIGGQKQLESSPRPSYWQLYQDFFMQVLFPQRLLQPAIGVLTILFAVLGFNAISNASAASLPGDFLYNVKITKENIQVALTSSPEKKVQIKLNSVAKRVDELNKVAGKTNVTSADKKDQLQIGSKQLVEDVKAVTQNLDKVSKESSPVVAATVAKNVDAKTAEAEKAVTEISKQLPAEQKVETKLVLKEAIDAADAANTNALTVVVEKHQTGQTGISSQEVAALVQDKIDITKAKLETFREEAKAVAASSTELLLAATAAGKEVPTTTAPVLATLPKEAESNLTAATKALTAQNFGEAISKLTESKEILKTAENSVAALVLPISSVVASSTATSTITVTASSTAAKK